MSRSLAKASIASHLFAMMLAKDILFKARLMHEVRIRTVDRLGTGLIANLENLVDTFADAMLRS